MAGRADPTFAQRAGAAPSALEELLDELPAADPRDAAYRKVAGETLDVLAHRLFIGPGRAAPPLAQAEQELAQKRQRMDKLVQNLRDGGEAHWTVVARYERYIMLLKQREEKAQQLEAEKQRWKQDVQQQLQQHGEAPPPLPPPPPPDEQQQQEAAGGGWLQRVRGLGAA